MVTEAGKELLRNTINTAKFHNRLIEENEMWKQWELERGLTMMVSDDDILKRIRKNHQCAKHKKREKSLERKPVISIEPIPGTSRNKSDRWDHGGFEELYPEADLPAKHPAAASNSPKRWDHSGYLELYPDADVSDNKRTQTTKEHSKKHKKKKRKHVELSNSDSEIYEEFKKYKRSQAKKEKRHSKLTKNLSSPSGYDNHVKEWRKLKEKYS